MQILLEMLKLLFGVAPLLANPIGGLKMMNIVEPDEAVLLYLEEAQPYITKFFAIVAGMMPGYTEMVEELVAHLGLDMSQLDLEQTATFAEYCTMAFLMSRVVGESGLTEEDLASDVPPPLPENGDEKQAERHSAWYLASMFRMEMRMKLAELFGEPAEENQQQTEE